jgi:hypothetical protein
VDERKAAVHERMGVGEPDATDRGTAHVGEHRGGLDPRGGFAEIVAVVRGRGAPLHLHDVAVVGRDAPAVGVLEPAEVAPALDEQRVGRAYQMPVDPGRPSRAQSIVAAHGEPRSGRRASAPAPN